jgi:class 3 adenylate cyclase
MQAQERPLSASELAGVAGVSEAEVDRLVGHGVLAARQPGERPFLATDARKVRLARACEQAGLPMEGIASAIRAGRLSFAFLDAAPYRRWAVRSARTYRQVSEELGVPVETLGRALEAMDFPPAAPDDLIREDELDVVPLLQLAFAGGVLDLEWTMRAGRGYAEGLRLAARVENEVYHARFELPVLQSGMSQREAMELASRLSGEYAPLVDRALLAMYRRQQELAWTEHLVEHVEAELEESGFLGRPERVPAMCFLDLVDYTRLTEERGDQAAAGLAGSVAVLVGRCARDHGGRPVKWLGDGVMLHFPDPAAAVRSALAMVEELPAAGLPPAHVGVAAGRVVTQGGDFFGRTVNLAARIAGRAGAGQVLVSERVAEAAPLADVTFVELEPLRLKGIARPVRVLQARRKAARAVPAP